MKSRRIHLMGASGSGVTTLGRALAGRLALPHHDTDDYFWLPTVPPYRTTRPAADRLRLMREIVLPRLDWVLRGTVTGWGDELIPLFDLVIYVTTSRELRLQRLQAREAAHFGADAVVVGGWRHDETKAFVDEALSEARKLENQLRTIRTERSVAVLHYSPIEGTIEGEPPAIYQYLGSQRLCEPIDRFDHVKAVVHGHAHHGTYEGRTPLGKPVYNVAQFVLRPLLGKPYTILEI